MISSTVPAAISNISTSGATADSYLQYVGAGRFIDNHQGRPLQPYRSLVLTNLPQATNRYLSGVVDQTGRYQNSSDGFNLIPYASSAAKSGALGILSTVKRTAFYKQSVITAQVVYNTHLRDLTQFDIRLTFRSNNNLSSSKHIHIKKKSFRVFSFDIPTSSIGAFDDAVSKLPASSIVLSRRPSMVPLLAADDLLHIGFVTDILLSAGFQFYKDRGDPYLSPLDKAERNVVAGAGGLVSGVFGAGAASLVCGLGAPVCFAGVATGIVVAAGMSIAWDYYVQPIIFEQRGIVPKRNLFSLN